MTSTKSQARAAILAVRRSLSEQTQERESTQLAGHLAALIRPGTTVCAYIPVGSEPGSLALVDDIAGRAGSVLLPVAREGEDGTPLPLRWARHVPGKLVAAPYGLREPPPPWLPADAVATAQVVLVPALAVDLAGTRLGRGAGFYDRTLALVNPTALVIAVVRDDELVDDLPAEPHDVPMTHALTPGRGLVTLGNRASSGNA
ncbi:5-formyltetrahydrofolate cyclo-ligase [Mycolicibacterium gilvum]|uniref:5-formyltetrahydrofolate cyclo-ligase n=1 Tax=Mycolicibacterium gilvum TaxID=1804 RepID=A0A378SSG3_9MYCO|nr:5-formyltetrahydrofolate cyclo-ligase [Mycolicibacterium gilvum]MCV7057066.1 5-formyltetrahydrofolate cyclo-ligase [Mycolicibacterium gilvum]STZ45295.1 5-formyltetrahydrofolate cyclo-ligase [Mycolicibacterium gilvum]